MTFEERIESSIATKRFSMGTASHIFAENQNISEKSLAQEMSDAYSESGKYYETGWYVPPPLGISALFSNGDDFSRLAFASLRDEEKWPNENHVFGPGHAGILYFSPVSKKSGAIGDCGMTVYTGTNQAAREHLKTVLALHEEVADYTAVGMEMRELVQFAMKRFADEGLNNERTIGITSPISSLGHTWPWTFEDPTASEQAIIDSQDFGKLRELLRIKRIYVNEEEKFKILETIAFSFEARLERVGDNTVPNTYFYMTIVFVEGKKSVHTFFNPVFEALGMDSWITSKYG